MSSSLRKKKQRKHLLATLTTAPELRSDDSLQLVSAYMRNYNLFKKLPTEMLNEISRHLTIRSLVPGEAVFRQGDDSDMFCIVLQGLASVYIELTAGSQVDEASDAKTEAEMDHTLPRNRYVPLAATFDASILVPVHTLKEGDSFGELGILENAPRSATVAAQTALDIICIDKQDYTNYFSVAVGSQYEKMASFLQKSPVFSHWSRADLLHISQFWTVGEVEGDELLEPGVYLIVKGGGLVITHRPLKWFDRHHQATERKTGVLESSLLDPNSSLEFAGSRSKKHTAWIVNYLRPGDIGAAAGYLSTSDHHADDFATKRVKRQPKIRNPIIKSTEQTLFLHIPLLKWHEQVVKMSKKRYPHSIYTMAEMELVTESLCASSYVREPKHITNLMKRYNGLQHEYHKNLLKKQRQLGDEFPGLDQLSLTGFEKFFRQPHMSLRQARDDALGRMQYSLVTMHAKFDVRDSFLSHLTQEGQCRFLQAATIEVVNRDRVILNSSDAVEDFFVILHGEVGVWWEPDKVEGVASVGASTNKRLVRIGTLRTGQTFGDLSAFFGCSTPLMYVSESVCEFAALNRSELVEMLAHKTTPVPSPASATDTLRTGGRSRQNSLPDPFHLDYELAKTPGGHKAVLTLAPNSNSWIPRSQTIFALLKSIDAFRCLKRKDLIVLTQSAQCLRFHAGDTIIPQGDESPGMFLIVAGEFIQQYSIGAVKRNDPERKHMVKNVVLSHLRHSTYFGEEVLFQSGNNALTSRHTTEFDRYLDDSVELTLDGLANKKQLNLCVKAANTRDKLFHVIFIPREVLVPMMTSPKRRVSYSRLAAVYASRNKFHHQRLNDAIHDASFLMHLRTLSSAQLAVFGSGKQVVPSFNMCSIRWMAQAQMPRFYSMATEEVAELLPIKKEHKDKAEEDTSSASDDFTNRARQALWRTRDMVGWQDFGLLNAASNTGAKEVKGKDGTRQTMEQTERMMNRELALRRWHLVRVLSRKTVHHESTTHFDKLFRWEFKPASERSWYNTLDPALNRFFVLFRDHFLFNYGLKHDVEDNDIDKMVLPEYKDNLYDYHFTFVDDAVDAEARRRQQEAMEAAERVAREDAEDRSEREHAENLADWVSDVRLQMTQLRLPKLTHQQQLLHKSMQHLCARGFLSLPVVQPLAEVEMPKTARHAINLLERQNVAAKAQKASTLADYLADHAKAEQRAAKKKKRSQRKPSRPQSKTARPTLRQKAKTRHREQKIEAELWVRDLVDTTMMSNSHDANLQPSVLTSWRTNSAKTQRATAQLRQEMRKAMFLSVQQDRRPALGGASRASRVLRNSARKHVEREHIPSFAIVRGRTVTRSQHPWRFKTKVGDNSIDNNQWQ